jgi:AcrR family transcriptional regulator
MARTAKPEEFAAKRREILDSAQKLIATMGYEQMSVQDLLDDLQISSGAFHHYFPSRAALLQSLIERIQNESGAPLLPIVHDPHLSAIEKLQGFFDTLDQLRLAHRVDVIEVARRWYTDDNALVRLKVDQAVFEQRAPLLAAIVRQGLREGVFTTGYPEQAGQVLMSLLQGMGNAHARLFFTDVSAADLPGRVAEIVAVHAAGMEAVERVLGAPPHCLTRTKPEAVRTWLAALSAPLERN